MANGPSRASEARTAGSRRLVMRGGVRESETAALSHGVLRCAVIESDCAPFAQELLGLRHHLRHDLARGFHIANESGGFADPHARVLVVAILHRGDVAPDLALAHGR